nr:TetR/AcrR family transcriptional regulator [uncultured Methanobrevibacter sp.]
MNTKDLILEKTLKLILEKGTIDISISEIRNSTGLTTGGIYYHFSDKNDIFQEILQKYMVDYIKIDFDKIILEGSSKNRIHDALFYILNHYITGVEIESINEKINYNSVILLLTPKGYAYEGITGIISQLETDIKMFLADIVEDGKRKNEIRQDISTEDIAESFHVLYMGIQYYWLVFPNEDIDSMFEKNFEMTWQAIEC